MAYSLKCNSNVFIIITLCFSSCEDARKEFSKGLDISEPNKSQDVAPLTEGPTEVSVYRENYESEDVNGVTSNLQSGSIFLQVVDVTNKIHEITGRIGKKLFLIRRIFLHFSIKDSFFGEQVLLSH